MKIEAHVKQEISNEDVGEALARLHTHDHAYFFAAYLRGLSEYDFTGVMAQLARSFAVCLDEGEYELVKRFLQVMNQEVNAPRGEV